ncbi:MAG: 3-phosphoshikimate 1-carboxyvinyltransferase [Pirellulales bacterium]|nr:3-phosphoshikimate 1-carboxyvinyltransferase [Pirellulales bacterium]
MEIRPCGALRGSVRPPGSKSLTNRALVCAALAKGRSILTGALDSEDTRVMFEALGQLGIALALDPAERVITVTGCTGKLPATRAEVFVDNSGTTARFLAAVLTLGQGIYRLDGAPRMRERPIQDLVDALRALGANVSSDQETGCPPLLVRAAGLDGGVAHVRGDISSQFLSGLLLAAPYARQPVDLVVEGELVSKPYVTMTLAVMREFGVEVRAECFTRFEVPNDRPYQGREYAIEPDASAASYFFAAAAITGGEVRVEGLSRASLQGDVAFVELLEQMGCQVRHEVDAITVRGAALAGGKLRGITCDMNAISDTVQTLSAVALFADGPTTITGVPHIRHKETDRLAALATELRKFGAEVDERPDGLRIVPPQKANALHGAAIDTYRDHRMAMSLALVGLRVPGVTIRDPGCVAKTYPEYFDDLMTLVAGS